MKKFRVWMNVQAYVTVGDHHEQKLRDDFCDMVSKVLNDELGGVDGIGHACVDLISVTELNNEDN